MKSEDADVQGTREKENCAWTFTLSRISRDLAAILRSAVSTISLSSCSSITLKMILFEAFACLFPYNLAMLAWQMMKGMLVLSACKMMLLEFCPSQHECLGGAFIRLHHHSPAKAALSNVLLTRHIILP
jgi:hypothetical protein